MTNQFLITEEKHSIKPDEIHPFVVVTRNNQPVSLVVHAPFAVNHPSPSGKTTAVLAVSPEQVSSKEDYPKVLAEAYILLYEAIDAEGVILVDENAQVFGVLSRTEVLLPDDDNIQIELAHYLCTRSQSSSDFKPHASNEPYVVVSTIYVCPVPGCSSPDINPYAWQKGRVIPPCPIHNKPRQPRRIEVDYYAD